MENGDFFMAAIFNTFEANKRLVEGVLTEIETAR